MNINQKLIHKKINKNFIQLFKKYLITNIIFLFLFLYQSFINKKYNFLSIINNLLWVIHIYVIVKKLT
jgi:hypothetical protein